MENLRSNKQYLNGKIFLGLVEDNVDPRRLGRIKIRVQGIFDGPDDIKTEDIPWAFPHKDVAGKTFSLPAIGKIVNVIFDNGNIYSPEYIYSEHYNINLFNKLDGLSDDEYKNFVALLFDHRTQIYSDDTELRLDYLYNNIKIKTDSINIHLKDNDQLLNLGHDYAEQSAILGDHWMEWFDEFMKILLNPSSLLGNLGAPILKPQIDQCILKYQKLRKTFLSKHVKIVDNGSCNKTDNNRKDTPTEDDVFDIDNTKMLNSNKVPQKMKDDVKNQRQKEDQKVEENKPNTADTIDTDQENPPVPDSPEVITIEPDPRSENVTLNDNESMNLDKTNSIEDRQSDKGLKPKPDKKPVDDPYDNFWNGTSQKSEREYHTDPIYGSYTEVDESVGGGVTRPKSESKSTFDTKNADNSTYKGKKIQNGQLSASDLVIIPDLFIRGTKEKVRLRDDAAASFIRLHNLYKKSTGKSLVINDSYRDFESQVKMFNKYGKGLAATPGRSKHGWGLALDINGTAPDAFDSVLYKWLKTNGAEYGWGQPANFPFTVKGKQKESWHWQYDPASDKHK